MTNVSHLQAPLLHQNCLNIRQVDGCKTFISWCICPKSSISDCLSSFNEDLRRSERRLTFNIDALKDAIAQSVNRSTTEIVSFEKLAEGGFNRIIEARFRDGKAVLARLPYPLLAPKHYAVASEAATLGFLRSQNLPVPKVLGYSPTHENPVGTEYLLLEKINGVCLGNIWYIIDNKARKKIMQQVVDIEEKMLRFSLPASGSIYYFKDLRPGDRHISFAQESAQNGGPEELVIGPTAQYEWHYKERTFMKDHNGPCMPDRSMRIRCRL